MVVECLWCKNELTYKDATDRNRITHGICNNCLKTVDLSMGKQLIDYVQTCAKPVFIVNEGFTLLYANTEAMKFIDLNVPEIKGNVIGDIFGCVYTRLPYSCGLTHRCSVCTVINAIKETYYNKRNRENVPVSITQLYDNDFVELNMMISTEKVGDVVLMQIDMIFPLISENLLYNLTEDENQHKVTV